MKPLTIQWNILTNFLFDVIKSRIKKYPLNFYEGAKEKKIIAMDYLMVERKREKFYVRVRNMKEM